MILTREQVEQMEMKEVKKNLRLLAQSYSLDLPLSELVLGPEEDLDQIANTLAYLEDRQQWLEQYSYIRGEN